MFYNLFKHKSMQNVLEIVTWYKKNFRALPWRETRNPYYIWLSEVILQQTQVVQGLQYYEKFVLEFPEIQDLAQADEQKVLKLWQGLGYYSRARNLHKTARIICNTHAGVFPDTYSELLRLPGIGAYTAAAIMSFAFKQPFPALDGNVYRVLSRLYNLGIPVDEPSSRPVFMEILNEMIRYADPADFNNAMMELGALICRPDKPLCSTCPVSLSCMALKSGTAESLPLKKHKINKRKRYFNFLYVPHGDKLYLQKRTATDIWQHMFQLPLIETESPAAGDTLTSLIISRYAPDSEFSLGSSRVYKHLLTHQEIHASFTELIFKQEPQLSGDDLLITDRAGLSNYPLPVLVEKFLLSL